MINVGKLSSRPARDPTATVLGCAKNGEQTCWKTGSWNWSLFIWLVVWNIFYQKIYWQCHHPNWRSPSFFRGVGSTANQYFPIFPSHHPYSHGISIINHPYHPLIDGGRSTTNQLWLDQESFTTTFPIVGPAAWPSRSCLGTTQLRKATIMPPGYTELVFFCSFLIFVSSNFSHIKRYIISNIRQLYASMTRMYEIWMFFAVLPELINISRLERTSTTFGNGSKPAFTVDRHSLDT